MGPSIQTELHIPELWFDFYARFLPGTAFVAFAKAVIWKDVSLPTVRELLIIAFAGYSCGLVVQPVSSRLTVLLEDRVVPPGQKPPGHLYVRALQERLRRESRLRQSMILSKMHGETTFFVQLFVLGSVLLALQLFTAPKSPLLIGLNIACLVAFPLAAFEVANRRVRRADDISTIDNSLGKIGK